ncbi:MAG: hypothetical protein NC310_01020 [Roseburia sp.]|nr:hypothetical protein [Anaeroplasma bactoclasticum]MCM1195635.1 hypothetical protein [Roseburia sp.]MCM1556620.1 hypothetical protein [Anaeroplasma bactoclasticum]
MARAVRKVSRAKTKDQKRETKVNKKLLIIIISIVLVIGIGLGVGLGIYYGSQKDNTYVSDKVYFNEEIAIDDEHKVSFNKENYQSIVRYLDRGDNAEEIFIFVYDGEAFYADELDEEHYDKDYVELITRIAQLQYEIDKAKEKNVSVELYIVDVAVYNSSNSSILFDSAFGSFYSDDELNYSPAFIYLKDGKYQQKVEYEDDKLGKQSHIISTSSWTDILNSSVKYAINYLDTL